MKKLTQGEFIQAAGIKHHHTYDYSRVDYKNNKTKVCIICPKHGEFWQAPSKHLQGQGCPKCRGTRRKTTEEFIEEAKRVHGDLYDYSETEYGRNNRTPVKIICKKHGAFWQTPVHHINCKCGCPLCCISHGEEMLKRYFDSNCIQYIMQFEVQVPASIRRTKVIKVDFFLPDYNCFVEYNGKQHYIPQEGFGGEVKFQQQVIRDQFLRDYCKEQNINLVEISYLEKDPITYLTNIINENSDSWRCSRKTILEKS